MISNDPIHLETFSSNEHAGESLIRQEAKEIPMIEVIEEHIEDGPHVSLKILHPIPPPVTCGSAHA